MCVEAASRAATDLGFDLTAVHDACATRPLEFGGQKVPAAQVRATALAAINGTYGRRSTSSIWRADAEGPDIQPVIPHCMA